MGKKISIIIPAYNEENNIEKCIKSLLSQTYKNIEIIIIDDGSTDKTYDICKVYSEKYNNIIVMKKENEGQGIARNYGIKIATGDYIGFMDADDEALPNMYEALYKKISADNTDMIIAVADFWPDVFEGKDVFYKEDIRKIILLNMLGAKVNSKYEYAIEIAMWGMLYKTELIKENNITCLSERKVYSEDFLFNVNCVLKSKSISIIKENLHVHNNNLNSYIHKYKSDYFDRVVNMYNEIKKLNLNEEENEYFYKRFLMSTRVVIKDEINLSNKSIREIKKKMKLIAENESLEYVMKNYEWWKCPISKACFYFGLRFKLYNLMIFLVKLDASFEKINRR